MLDEGERPAIASVSRIVLANIHIILTIRCANPHSVAPSGRRVSKIRIRIVKLRNELGTVAPAIGQWLAGMNFVQIIGSLVRFG